MKKFFTILFFALLLNACHNSVFAQSTWIKTQNLDQYLPPLHQDSLSVGPLEISTRPDGKIWTLMQVNQDHDTKLYLIDTLGTITFSKIAAHYGGHYNEDCNSLHTTSDSGCVYIQRHHLFGSYIRDTVYRVGSDGSVLWTKVYYEQFGIPAQLANSIVPTHYNTFLLSLTDNTLLELNANGSTIRTRNNFNSSIKIHPLADSSIVFVDSSKIKRETFLGSSLWTTPAAGFSICYADTSMIYAKSNSEVIKLNATNGNLIWIKPISSLTFSKTSDDGFVTSNTNVLSKYDSSGVIEWTTTKDFPQFDFKAIIEFGHKTYLTGGCWKNINSSSNRIGYSPFLATLDSLGNGVIDSTNYYFIGNANDNNLISFGDDAVYVAAAINNSGPARDSLLQYGCCRSVFGTEWSGEFCTGINYKYSDVDGNGVIDTNDVVRIGGSNIWYQYLITPHWLRLSENPLAPPLIFLLENNYINILDTVKVHVILGSSTQPVDSIYGLSFDLSFSNINLYNMYASYSIHPTSLGDTAINLYLYYIHSSSGGPATASLLLCRTDHLNVSVAGDTIASLNFVFPLDTNIGAQGMFIVRYSAINECGSPITLNIVSDTIYSAALGISKNELKNVRVYPNPSSEKIIFDLQSNDIDELSIFNAIGRKILAINNPGNKYILNVRDFAGGVYYFSTHGSNKIYRSKFLVVH